MALRALASAREKFPNVELHVGGDGPEEAAARELADELGIAEAVHFLGFLPHERFLDELGRADLFVQPSVTAKDGDSEGGAPTTLLEAQACGVPILASTHADIPFVVQDGVAGRLAPEGDAEALGEQLIALLSEPQRWAAMGEAGRRHVAQRHDAATQTARLEDLYQALVDAS